MRVATAAPPPRLLECPAEMAETPMLRRMPAAMSMAMVLALLLALGLAAQAGATVYCVAEPACPAGGVNEGATANNLESALEHAHTHPNMGGPDVVLIGAGTFSRSEGFEYTGEPVVIKGAGAGQTTLTRTGKEGSSAVFLNATESSEPTLSELRIVTPATNDMTGLSLQAGKAEGVTIESSPTASSSTGLSIAEGVFSHGTIHAPNSTGIDDRGGEVLYSTVSGGGWAVQASTHATLKGDTLSGGTPIVSYYAQPLVVEDTVIEQDGSTTGMELVANLNGASEVKLRHVAIVGGGQRGIFLRAEQKNATLTMSDSIVSEAVKPLLVAGLEGGTATFTASYSSFDASKDAIETGGVFKNEDPLPATPMFVSPLTHDYHLAPGSPLIDAGTPGPLGVGEFKTDIAGNPRIVNGRRDVGPYEYGWRGPTVTAAASKATTDIGANVSFNGAASTVEPGDAVTGYQWSFDDGASVSAGAVAEHAFLKSGLHTATLTAKDAAGVSSTATVNVTVKPELPVCLIEGGCCERAACPALSRSIKDLAVKPLAFKAALRGGSIAAARGAQVTYKVTGAVGLADFVVEQVLKGTMNAAGACVKPHKGLKGRPCIRYSQTKTSFSHISPAGGNRFHLTGRAKGKKLQPGRYVLVGHLASQPHGPFATANFRIVR
jgi:PKD domain